MATQILQSVGLCGTPCGASIAMSMSAVPSHDDYMRREAGLQREMTSCPRPEFVSCQDDSDCARLVRGTTDQNEATCQGGYCEHACMEQYRQGALPALGGDLLAPWCGATNDGVPWGSVCVKDSAWRQGELPVQCALPYEGYVCPPGWEKALWNDGEASKFIDCNGAVRHCYEDGTPYCQNGAPLCGGPLRR